MHAYVSLRGSDRQKEVTRDARSGHFAALVIAHPDGTGTGYELDVTPQGAVRLLRKLPGQRTECVYMDIVPEESR